jgi:hypothetical protein
VTHSASLARTAGSFARWGLKAEARKHYTAALKAARFEGLPKRELAAVARAVYAGADDA